MDNKSGNSGLLGRVSKPFKVPFKTPFASTPGANSEKPLQSKPLLTAPAPTNALVRTEKNLPDQPSTTLYYKIFYTKDIKKKKKSYSEGFVEISRFKCKIYDTDGKEVLDTTRGRNFKEVPKMDEEYLLGSYEIQIQEQVPTEEFTSGSCFLKGQVSVKKEPMMQNRLLHKKINVQNKTNSEDKYTEVQVPEGAFLLNEGNREKLIYSCFIDPYLGNKMRIHQKEGIKFMFECITGFKGQDITGCILADSMGLGKTLQTIGLIWTLVKQNPYSTKRPYVNKAVVLAPLSVVKNWEKEIIKWLGSTRMQPLVAIGDKEVVDKTITNFTQGNYRCLLTSYEVFMRQVEKLNNHCDLLILDEGHRLKNMENKIFQCFSQFNCKKRIILTGTPLQNKLEELYACCEFLNPGIFPNLNSFRKVFINPILTGLKKNAKAEEHSLAIERSKNLSKILSSFILRRPASILQNILPPKHEYFVLLKLTEAQKAAYKKILNYKIYRTESETTGDAFSLILVLRKLLNNPLLLANDNSDSARLGISAFPENYLQQNVWETSVKFQFTKDLVDNMKTGDKIIIVSYYTQTLDLIEKLCNASNVKFLRLDGQVAAMKRQRLVDRFNDKTTDIKVFLLCGKAGGTGLNLTGANEMILFEADWNPSNDNQVMGRIWRDGQQKEAKIYRLISCGTIEERIMQRQFVKENLSLNVVDERNIKSLFNTSDLKKIFKFEDDNQSIIFTEQENDREKSFETNDDFLPAMRNYITFIKKQIQAPVEQKKEVKIRNEFEEGEVFLGEEKNEEDEEQKVEDDDESENDENGKNGKNGSDGEECFFDGDDKSESEDNEEKKEEEEKPVKRLVKMKEKTDQEKSNQGKMVVEEPEGKMEEEMFYEIIDEEKNSDDIKNETQDFGLKIKENNSPPQPDNKIKVVLSKLQILKPVEAPKEKNAEEERPDPQGKESQKRKALNPIGENVLKKLKLI